MARYVVVRLASLLFVLVAVSVIAFLLMHAVPGGPFDVTERRLPEATRLAQARKWGLDRPLWEQYLRYMANALRGDFGVPFQSPTETVLGLIARTWPVTIKIGLPTIALAFSLGTIAALKQNTWLDYAVTLGATLGLVLPNFVVAIWLVLVISDWR
jgi:ABC-type dipeptide/oligopeptide/nickel transport system permease component